VCETVVLSRIANKAMPSRPAHLPRWSQLLGTSYANEFRSVRILSIVAMLSPTIIVVAIIVGFASRIDVGLLVSATALVVIGVVCTAISRLRVFGRRVVRGLEAAERGLRNPVVAGIVIHACVFVLLLAALIVQILISNSGNAAISIPGRRASRPGANSVDFSPYGMGGKDH